MTHQSHLRQSFAAGALVLAMAGACAPAAAQERVPGAAIGASEADEPAAPEPTSRIGLPAVLDGRRLPPVIVDVTLTRLVAVDVNSLLAALDGSLNPARMGNLEQRRGQFVAPDDLAALGITVTFDPASLNIALALALAQPARAAQSFDFNASSRFGSGERAQPGGFALGVTGTLIGGRDFNSAVPTDRLIYDFAGFANVGGRGGVYLTYGGTFNLEGGQGQLFQRDRITAFRDFEGKVLRVAAGDLVPRVPIIAGDVELLGLSIERRYDALQPLRNIRPTGRRSFTVDRPSRIEIYANGALVQTIDANPGQVDLNQIPALSLSSNIAIIVEDTTGRRQIDSFTLVNDIEILGDRISEFGFSLGMLRQGGAIGFDYSDRPIATGEYSRGIGDTLTLGGHFIVSEDYQNLGLRAATLAPGGAIFAGASFSRNTDLNGYAASIAYRGDPLRISRLDSQFNLRLDYQSPDYRPLSQFQIFDTVRFDIAADYRINITNDFAVVAGGNYFERYNQPDTTRALFAGVQANLGRLLASATARYARIGDQTDRGVLFTLTVPLARDHFPNASYDTATNQARFEARRIRDITAPEFDYGVIAETGAQGERLTGQARFASSRFNLDVEALAVRPSSAFGGRDQNVGQFRLQTGLAFADGSFGIGRNPAQGFVMVQRHASLEGAQVDVENSGVGRRAGQANGIGPAVIQQVGGYRPDLIRLEALGAPFGYDIDAGEYVTDPGALSGVKITVGSDAFHTVMITLMRPDGAPLALQSGLVRRDGSEAIETVFTNGAGRTVLTQLAPGKYLIEFTADDLVYDLVVGADDPAFTDRGPQTMQGETMTIATKMAGVTGALALSAVALPALASQGLQGTGSGAGACAQAYTITARQASGQTYDPTDMTRAIIRITLQPTSPAVEEGCTRLPVTITPQSGTAFSFRRGSSELGFVQLNSNLVSQANVTRFDLNGNARRQLARSTAVDIDLFELNPGQFPLAGDYQGTVLVQVGDSLPVAVLFTIMVRPAIKFVAEQGG